MQLKIWARQGTWSSSNTVGWSVVRLFIVLTPPPLVLWRHPGKGWSRGWSSDCCCCDENKVVCRRWCVEVVVDVVVEVVVDVASKQSNWITESKHCQRWARALSRSEAQLEARIVIGVQLSICRWCDCETDWPSAQWPSCPKQPFKPAKFDLEKMATVVQ